MNFFFSPVILDEMLVLNVKNKVELFRDQLINSDSRIVIQVIEGGTQVGRKRTQQFFCHFIYTVKSKRLGFRIGFRI